MNCNPPLESFKIVIEIQPDATKPVEMKVKYGNKSVFGVADKLPGKCRGFQYFSNLPVLVALESLYRSPDLIWTMNKKNLRLKSIYSQSSISCKLATYRIDLAIPKLTG
jgi:hypothetical protein